MKYFVIILYILPFTECANVSRVNEPKLCQWKPTRVDSKLMCQEKCSKVKGLFHPIEKQLICFHDQAQAKTIFTEINDGLGLHTCECVHATSRETIRCSPRVINKNLSYENCYQTCSKYTAFIFLTHSKRRLSIYCEEAFKVELFNLESLVSATRHESKNGNKYRKCSCTCGLHLNDLQPEDTESRYQKQIAKITEKSAELAIQCQFKSIHIPDTGTRVSGRDVYCMKRCSVYNGFLTPNRQLICFHRKNQAVAISKNYHPCVCALKTPEDGKVQHCQPKIVFSSIKHRQVCKNICSEFSILRVFKKKALKIIWCGRIPNENNIIESIDWSLDINKDVANNSTNYNCQCGLKFDQVSSTKITNHEKNVSPVKKICREYHNYSYVLAKSCSMGQFIVSNKLQCEESCRRASGYLSSPKEELICYHDIKRTRKIASLNNACECGLVFNRFRKGESINPCIPKLLPTIAEDLCNEECKNHTAYLFSRNRRLHLIRCEHKDNHPKRVYENLDYKIAKCDSILIKERSYRHECMCECGLTSEMLDKNKASTSHSKFIDDLMDNQEEDIFGDVLKDTLVDNDDRELNIFGDVSKDTLADNDDRELDIFGDVLKDTLVDNNELDIPRDVLKDALIREEDIFQDTIKDTSSYDNALKNQSFHLPEIDVRNWIQEYFPAGDFNVPSIIFNQNKRSCNDLLTENTLLPDNDGSIPIALRETSISDFMRESTPVTQESSRSKKRIRSNSFQNEYRSTTSLE